jgi:hypothetical protein
VKTVSTSRSFAVPVVKKSSRSNRGGSGTPGGAETRISNGGGALGGVPSGNVVGVAPGEVVVGEEAPGAMVVVVVVPLPPATVVVVVPLPPATVVDVVEVVLPLATVVVVLPPATVVVVLPPATVVDVVEVVLPLATVVVVLPPATVVVVVPLPPATVVVVVPLPPATVVEVVPLPPATVVVVLPPAMVVVVVPLLPATVVDVVVTAISGNSLSPTHNTMWLMDLSPSKPPPWPPGSEMPFLLTSANTVEPAAGFMKTVLA